MIQAGSDGTGHEVVKARETELRGDDEEAEEQKDGRPVDIGHGVRGGDTAENHQGNGAQQGDAGPVGLEPGNVADGDAQISDRKNCQNGMGRLHVMAAKG